MRSRSCSAVVVSLGLALAACDSAITLEIAGDRPVPRGVDAICVGVADTAASGGHQGQRYRLTGELASLPQTLRIEPGGAASAYLWVRADRGGVPVAWALARTDLDGDVRLVLDRCPLGRASAPAPVGSPLGPASAKLVASHGSGNLVVALAAEATIFDVKHGQPTVAAAPPLPAGAVVAAIAIDVDGDCDDDLVIATDGEAPVVWRREHAGFVVGDPIGSAPVAALAAADVDGDGDIDLVSGAGAALTLWRNDGGGRFTRDASALVANGRVSAVRALALGDLDGDGNPDLMVGQGGGPLVAWLGEPGGTGSFQDNDAAVPPVPLDVAALALVDADADELELDPDLVVAVRGGPMRLYVDRGGHLEDQSFVRLPQPAPTANAIAIGGWDDGCEPDAVIAADGASPALRGEPGGTFSMDAMAAAATDVVMVDLDDDGDLDAVLATAEGVVWLAR